MAISDIRLHSDKHAIEFVNFVITFRSQIDAGDEGRFDERFTELLDLFASIEKPEFFQIAIGSEPGPAPVMRILSEFGRDGKPGWTAQFGENAISLACRRYTNWKEIWPEAERRLSVLLSLIDKFKFIGSIEYGATDRFYCPIHLKALLSRHIFKKNELVPDYLLNYDDPRWDFACGRFIVENSSVATLERLEGRSVIESDSVAVTIANNFSKRFLTPVRVKDILSADSLSDDNRLVFSDFHDRNKEAVKSALNDDLLDRMGLIS